MMVQALLLLPRLVVTPPARLAVVTPHRAAVRRFTAPPVGGGRPARGAEPLLGTTSLGRASSSDAHGVACPQQWLPMLVAATSVPLTHRRRLVGVFTSKDALEIAVSEYDADPTGAIAMYGPIADWEVSAITDLSKLFYDGGTSTRTSLAARLVAQRRRRVDVGGDLQLGQREEQRDEAARLEHARRRIGAHALGHLGVGVRLVLGRRRPASSSAPPPPSPTLVLVLVLV
eukprot:CAMPEP_0118845814 /NCGR_PEP_ID=MMETSP1162-20130426/90204_1 /TAXON_ID=33656 /ORGANISM="Phaeocystis Sp, Strain CCMP2710" /LENGTH=229 /DNA_ID=CAMNT_0006777973 /DNA_START=161 /DNA_END=847 /DNA_ORIENTATION=-